MEHDRPRQAVGHFQPRLGGPQAAAPFNPAMYFPLAIIGGSLAVAFFAARNLRRITRVRDMDRKTWATIAGLGTVFLLVMMASPDSWWVPSSDIRLVARLVAVGGSVPLYWLHRGPALGRQQHHGHYQSLWKFWWQIALAWAVHSAVLTGFAVARGLN